MADTTRQNKDAESGQPVELDPVELDQEKQGQQMPGEEQGGGQTPGPAQDDTEPAGAR